MIILYILGIILLIILLIILIILLIPYSYVIKGDNLEMTKVELSFLCVFNQVGITLLIYSLKNTALQLSLFNYSKEISFHKSKEVEQLPDQFHEELGEKVNKKLKKEKKSKKWSSSVTFELIKAVLELMKTIIREILPHKYSIDLTVGFDEPMYTGLFYGLYTQLSSVVKTKNITVKPVFNETKLRYQVSIQGKIWLIMIIGDILKFIISSPVRKQILSSIRS